MEAPANDEPVMIPKEHHSPSVDVKKIANEIKLYIDKKKLDHVDYDYVEIEMYPSPVMRPSPVPSGSLGEDGLPDMPEFAKFCAQWEALFDYADKITKSSGVGFPNDDISVFEDVLAEIQKEVNSDDVFWKKIRDEILPIYVHSKDYEKVWKQRWASVSLFYDPVGITVTTHKKMVNKLTGEVTKRELIHQREIPAGIVVKIQ